MTRWIVAQQAPLQVNSESMFLVSTKVGRDILVAVFDPCAIAQETADRYPSLKLTDVYATIAFYFTWQQEVEADFGQLLNKLRLRLFVDLIRQNSTHSLKAIAFDRLSATPRGTIAPC